MFTQLGHLINAAFPGLFLLSLIPALGFVPLFLLPSLFFAPFLER
jgi:hypothetical protein